MTKSASLKNSNSAARSKQDLRSDVLMCFIPCQAGGCQQLSWVKPFWRGQNPCQFQSAVAGSGFKIWLVDATGIDSRRNVTGSCVQHGFDNFLSRLEIAEFEQENVRGRLSTRDTRNKVRPRRLIERSFADRHCLLLQVSSPNFCTQGCICIWGDRF